MIECNPDAEYAQLALSFARALVAGDFERAHEMLSSKCGEQNPPASLRSSYESMIEYGDGPPSEIEVMGTMEEWRRRHADDVGWAYVSISGETYAEAVTAIVAPDNGVLKIRYIEWGRP